MTKPRTHTAAVGMALDAYRGALTPADEPLVELLRTLARQCDAAGPDGPGTRLSAGYLSALRQIHARHGGAVKKPGMDKIDQLKARRPRYGVA